MPSIPPLVEPVSALSTAEHVRTARHRSLAALGEIGQRRLAAAHIAIVGAGGLGSPAVLALAAAGVGTLTVIDDDLVEVTNLQRQVMHRLADVGARKVDSATRAAADLAPDTRVITVAERLTSGNARTLLAGADLVLDGSDTFDTREAVAAACEDLGVPLVWGTVQAFDAQVTVFWSAPPAGHEPVRLADLYPTGSTGEVPTCADVGVLGALCLQVGSLMSTEAIKLITGIGESLLGRVLVIDGLRARQHEIPLRAAVSASIPMKTMDAVPAPLAFISAEELASAGDRVIVDVRERAELASGVISGSRHIPLADLLADPAALAPLGPVVVLCQAGVRAQQAARALTDAGIEATVLSGGMDAWTAAQSVHA